MKVFVTVQLDCVSVMPAPPNDDENATIQQLVTVRSGMSLGKIEYSQLRKLSTGDHELDLTVDDFGKFEKASQKQQP